MEIEEMMAEVYNSNMGTEAKAEITEVLSEGVVRFAMGTTMINEEVTAQILEAAKKVLKAFPNEPFAVRCDIYGHRCVVCNEKETIYISVEKVTSEDIQVQRNLKRKAKEGEIFFYGIVKGAVAKNVDWAYKGLTFSTYFESAEEAIEWVKVAIQEMGDK